MEGVIITNNEGIPIRPAAGMDENKTNKTAASIAQLTAKARSVIRDLDPQVCVDVRIALSPLAAYRCVFGSPLHVRDSR